MTEHVFPCPNLAKGQPCGPCEDLAAINQEIFKAESVVTALKSKRTLIYGRMNPVHDPLTSKLPSELVSKIFANFLPETVAENYGPYGTHRGAQGLKVAQTTPFVLGAVCTSWRAITWSTPLLWTSITVDVYDLRKANVDILEEWLHRSGELPLYIRICEMTGDPLNSIQGAVQKVMDLFAQYTHRWFHFEFISFPSHSWDFFRYLPTNLAHAFMLNTLKIKVNCMTKSEIDLGMIPNLRTLVMDCLRTNMLLNMDWKKITNIEASIASMDMCYDLFSKAPFLTHCTFHLLKRYLDPAAHITRDTIIQHNHLTFLHARYWNPATSAVLSLMEFPALEHLVIDSNAGSYNLESIKSLLQRSHCSLKTLEIDLSHRKMDFELHAIPFLAEIPSIETLEFRCRGNTNDSNGNSVNPLLTLLSTTAHTQETTTGQFAFLPNLRTLRIKHIAVPYGHVLDVIRAHSNGSTVLTPTGYIEGSETHQHIRPLQSLYVHLWGHKYGLIELDIAQKLQRAVRDGFNLTIINESWRNGLTDILDESLHPSEA